MKRLFQIVFAFTLVITCLCLPEKANAATYLLEVGDRISLSDSNYHNATGYSKVWTSSNPSVASVYGNGISATVEAYNLGVAIITCQTSAYKTVTTRVLGADGEWYTQTNTYQYSATSTHTIRVVEFVDVNFNGNKGEPSKKVISIEKNTAITTYPTATRSKYLFQGWYTKAGSKVNENTYFYQNTILYAKWSSAKFSKVQDVKLKSDYKQIYVTYDAKANAEGYQIAYATKQDFSNEEKVTTKNTKKYLDDLKSNQTYYIRVRAYRKDSKGDRCYGSYSDVAKITTPKYVLSDTKVVLAKNQSQSIKLKGASGKEKFKSSDTSVVKVNSQGKLTALKKGSATISVTYDGKTFKCSVVVEEPKLNRTSVKLLTTQTYELKAKNTTLTPTFKSLDTSIANINSKGVITAKKAGVVYVQVKIQDQTYQCKVIVEKPSFSTRDKSLVINESYQIKLKNTSFKPTFINKTPDIINLDETGKVTTLKKGEALVHVVLNDKKYAIKLHVENPQMPYHSYRMSANSETTHILKIDTNLPITYTSSDESILTIDNNGKMVGHQAGSVTITAKIRSKTLQTKVYVEELTYDSNRKDIKVGETIALQVEGTERSIIAWEIENNNFTNNGDGTFTAVKAAYTTIYAVLENNDKIPFYFKVIGNVGTITNPYEVTSFSKQIYQLGSNAYEVALQLAWYKIDFISCTYQNDILSLAFDAKLVTENEYTTQKLGYAFVSSINDYYYDELGNAYRLKEMVGSTNHNMTMVEGTTKRYEVQYQITDIVGDKIIVPFRTKYYKDGSLCKPALEYFAYPITK